MLRYLHEKPTLSEIRDFFYCTDDEFDVPLSEKVNIEDYTQKLYTYSDFYLCCDDDKIVGMCCCYTNRPPDAYISHVCVMGAYQGRGVFGHLLSVLKDYCLANGIDNVSLEVGHNNLRARRVYEKYGFVLESERDHSSILKLTLSE